mmetsp:Transcript_53070/g.119598  ORF Transcript_53070/g.119598 Transcript_53070/m.119598 type:complete len:266 (-) Transcript_53070:163-960(-)
MKPAMLCTKLWRQGPMEMFESHAESRITPQSTSASGGTGPSRSGWASSRLLSVAQHWRSSVQVMKPPLLKRCTKSLFFMPSGVCAQAIRAVLMAEAHWHRSPKLAFMLQLVRTITDPGLISRYSAAMSSMSPTLPPPQAKRKTTAPFPLASGGMSTANSLISRLSFAYKPQWPSIRRPKRFGCIGPCFLLKANIMGRARRQRQKLSMPSSARAAHTGFKASSSAFVSLSSVLNNLSRRRLNSSSVHFFGSLPGFLSVSFRASSAA